MKPYVLLRGAFARVDGVAAMRSPLLRPRPRDREEKSTLFECFDVMRHSAIKGW